MGPAEVRSVDVSRETRTRLDELASEWSLPAGARRQLEGVLVAVAEEPSAITAVRDPAAAVDVHVSDSLAGLAVPELRTGRHIADLGAGAGFPGLVLAVALPDASVVLVESVGRKCAFLRRRRSERSGSRNAEVVHARAEAWPDGLGAHATSSPPARWPRCRCWPSTRRRCCATGGVLVAWKGRRDPDEEARRPPRRPRRSGSTREAAVRVAPYPGARRAAPRTCCARSPRRRPASRGGPAWRASARSA